MPSDRRALCVGINRFPFAPVNQLNGCVKDAHDMAAVFRDLVGFSPADITILTDQQATKANITAVLRDMVNAARAGTVKYIVFSLASHGTYVPDFSGDEPDNKDEAFCTYDLAPDGRGGWDLSTLLVDDELCDLFLTLPADVLLEVYLDTCHSGTGLRDLNLGVSRYAPPPSPAAAQALATRTSRGLAGSLSDAGSQHHILWSACRAEQSSYEHPPDTRLNGAFTYFWTRAMRASNNTLSRRQILQPVRADITAAGHNQEPQLQVNATTT